ncbi:MAG: CHASE3 domain-containing protein [Acidobacteriaceae bacterium]
MQNFYKRAGVLTGFALLLLILIANAFITRRQLAVQNANQSWVLHSRQVLFELSQVESLLKDAETGQRGFLYTGQPTYLQPYNVALMQIEPHLRNLSQLTADNPRQQAYISQLHRLTQEKLNELAQTIQLYKSGETAQTKALVLSDYGLATMNKIRQLMNQMMAEETSLEQARMTAYQRSVRSTIISIYFASILAALGLLLLAYRILREMNLREKHGAEIREREEWFRVTLTSIGDAVIATDRQGMVTFVNPMAAQLTGTSFAQAKAKPIQEIFPIFHEYTHQVSENPVKKVLEQGKIVGLANHTVLRHRDGSLTPIEDSAAPIRNDNGAVVGVVLVFRDATYHRKSQEVLRKAEKLAAAARLAATVAHEINNPLEAVGNLIYLAKAAPEMPTEAMQQLSLAEQELARVSHLTRQTLGFYRESSAAVSVEIPTLIESVLALYSNKFNTKNITVVRDFGECPPIQVVRGEMNQVVANLISNAADAVGNNGVITIRLACKENAVGPVVHLAVEDDGPGVTEENEQRIFEPFFTTKKDVGTGLGLWVVKEIVERHGGAVGVNSHNGHGSRGAIFTVQLPCNRETPETAEEEALA